MHPRFHQPDPIGIIRATLVLLTLFLAACSSGAMEVNPPPGIEEDFAGTDWPTTGRRTQAAGCADDHVRMCSYYLPEHNGVRPCVVGHQICQDNQWSRCTEGLPPPDAGLLPSDAGAAFLSHDGGAIQR